MRWSSLEKWNLLKDCKVETMEMKITKTKISTQQRS